MTKQAEFDKGASAKRAAECLFHVDEAERTSAKFKLEFSQEIAKAKRNGVKSWGGARYPGSYGAGTYHGLTFCLWPKDAKGNVTETTCAAITVGPNAQLASPDAKVFVPTNSPDEVNRFLSALTTGDPNNVQARNCVANFAPNTVDGLPLNPAREMRPNPIGNTWWGMMDCSKLAAMPACNETKLISASRLCQFENGMFSDCDACQNLAEPEDKRVYSTIDQFYTNYSQFSAAHPGMEFLVAPSKSGTRGDRCRVIAACMNISSNGCPSVTTSGGHVFCFAGETKITMADGTQKPIRKIKAGEKVMAFDAKHARNGALMPAVVKATAVTKKQKIVKINDLRVTPLHKIVLANGRSVAAQDIKVGDRIMMASGMVDTVRTIDKDQAPTTVYNLVLEKGMDGYLAGGVRVMSYPILKGMDSHGDVELAKAKGKPHAGSRRTSSLKR